MEQRENVPNSVEEARDYLVAYVDGELDEPARTRVEDLIRRHPELEEDVAFLRASWDALDVDEAPRTSPAFVDDVLARLRDENGSGPRVRMFSSRRGITALAAAAVLILAVAGFLVLSEPAGEISEAELVANMELLEDLELLEAMSDDLELLAVLDDDLLGFDDWEGEAR